MSQAVREEPVVGEVGPARGTRRAVALVAGAVVLVGVAVRIWALGRHAINSDEAVVGLMAHEILRGHLSAFYWGQDYGGGEPYAVAAVFALIGQSTFALGLTPVLLDAVAATLVWRIGRRLLGARLGWVAGLLFWVWPEVIVWQSTIEYGFRWFALDAGLGASLVALRIGMGDARRRPAEAAACGCLCGLGWWATPEILYFVVPILAYLAYLGLRGRVRLRAGEWALGSAAAAFGAAPWIWANVRSHLASLHAGVQPDEGILHHWKVLVVHTVPLILGLQLRVSGGWLVGPVLGNLAEYLALVAAAVLVVQLARRDEGVFLVAYAVSAPVVYGLSPFTWYWQDGRYAIFLAPLVALFAPVALDAGARALVGPAARLGSRVARALGPGAGTARSAGALGVAIGLTAGAAVQLHPFRPDGVAESGSASWTSWRYDPSSGFAALASELERAGVTRLYAGYWIAYSLTFVSGGAVVASDISYVRNPAYLAEVEAARRPAWLFMNPAHYRRTVALTGVSLNDPSCAASTDRCLLPRTFEAYLHGRRDPYRAFEVGPFVAVVPRRPVSPVVLSETLGLRSPYRLSAGSRPGPTGAAYYAGGH